MNTPLRNKAPESIAKGAVFVALTVVSAQIAIPLPPIPWTLQVLAVLLCGGLTGSSLGAISQLVYILIGIIGLPVFAGFTGGIQILASPTFGYLLGFPIASAITGLYSPKAGIFRRSPAIFLVAVAPIYILGVLYLYFFAPVLMGKAFTIKQLAVVGVLPFIIPDTVKAILAWILCRRIRPLLENPK